MVSSRLIRGLAAVAVSWAATGGASCRKKEAPRDPATRVIVPEGRAARERQQRMQAGFATMMAGTPARLVWVHDPSESSSDTFAESESLHLMGWDPREGGPRRLVATPGNYGRPLLTPDGQHIIFTEKRVRRRDDTRHFRPRIRIADWETGTVRTLGHGFAVATWAEPGTKRPWIYALDTVHASRLPSVTGSNLIRFTLEAPEHRESVWSQTRLSLDSIQISRDGRRFAALFPWPDAGIGDFASGRWTKLDVGCWPALAPDDSYVAWVFDGPHRRLRMVAPGHPTGWPVSLSDGPDLRGKEAYHPRWSNHPQFIVFTGPYTRKKQGSRNAISTGGLSAEIHLGRFSADLRRLEASVRLTHNKTGDFYPDLWVGDGERATLAGFPQQPAVAEPESPTWPPSPQNLVFVWRDLRAANELPGPSPRPACHLVARGMARFTATMGALLDGGGFEADAESNAAIAAAIRAGRGVTWQALVTEGPGAADAPPLPLLSWQAADGHPFLSLVRHGPGLHLTIGNGPTTATGTIIHPPAAGQPVALSLVWHNEALHLALNGTRAGDPVPVPPDLATRWPEGKLGVGSPVPSDGTGGRTSTRTSIERLTVHGRPLTTEELATRATIDRAVTANRPVPPRVRVRARVVEATEPDLTALDTYHRLLVDHTYEVTAVLEGSLEAGRIAVLHWAVLDDRPVPGFPRPLGHEVELDLEPHAAHPELEGELTQLASEEFGLPLFLDVATPAPPRPR
jgi:hypothetical protein